MALLGTSKDKQQTRAPHDARDLAEVKLLDGEGREVQLGDYWRERPAVLVFLRHYG